MSLQVTAVGDRELVLERAFAAPRERVFDAFTRPDLLRRWFGARGWNLVVCEVDLRPGGRWRFVSRGPDGAELGHGGVYREVARPERLVYTETYDDQWAPGEALVSMVLAERDGGSLMRSTITYATPEIRDRVLASPMRRGAGEGFDRLDAVLAEDREEVA